METNEGLKEILPDAFYGSKINEISFSSTVIRVDLSSFAYCAVLESIEFKADTPFDVTDLINSAKFGYQLFDVDDLSKQIIKVPEASYEAYYEWLNEYTDNYGDYIDCSDYSDAAVTMYAFISQGATKIVKAKKLLQYPIPPWEGEGTMYFAGWYSDEGVWQEEISLPQENPYGTTVTYYAKWSEEPRRDGSEEWFACLLSVDQQKAVDVPVDKTGIWFETAVNPGTAIYDEIELTIYIDGEVFGYIYLYPEDIQEDIIRTYYVDLTWIFDEMSEEITIKFTMSLNTY